MEETNNENLKKSCPGCNNECGQEDLFCNKCGHKFEKEQEPKKRICPQCQKECNSDDIFCKFCGYKLEEEKAIKELICLNCGEKYKENDTFCGECGAKLQQSGISQFHTNSNGTINSVTCTPQSNNNQYQEKIRCPYCQNEVNRYVKKCPHCGEWLRGVSHFGCGSFMMLITTILGLVLFFAGNDVDLPLLGATGGGVILILCFLYFLPSLISDWRGHDSKLAIFIVNLLFGWTFIGWFAALIFAFTGRSR